MGQRPLRVPFGGETEPPSPALSGRLLRKSTNPIRTAFPTNSAVFVTPSFLKIRNRCVTTVRKVMPRSAATCFELRPSAIRRATSRSRGVRPTFSSACIVSHTLGFMGSKRRGWERNLTVIDATRLPSLIIDDGARRDARLSGNPRQPCDGFRILGHGFLPGEMRHRAQHPVVLQQGLNFKAEKKPSSLFGRYRPRRYASYVVDCVAQLLRFVP